MKKLLMHKDTIVASFASSKASKKNINQVEVLVPELFPFTTQDACVSFRRWLLFRRTSPSRKDLQSTVSFYGDDDFYSENLASLFDTYWVKDENSDRTFDDVSLYKKTDFVKDSVYMSLAKPAEFKSFDQASPNLTIPSKSPLFWFELDGQRGIVNMQAQLDMQLYKNAKAAGLDLFHDRKYLIDSYTLYSFKPSVTSEKVEKIPFDQLYTSLITEENKDDSVTAHLVRCCEHYQIPQWKDFIKQILQFNEQNPQNKIFPQYIGVLRDTDTLEYLGFDKL